LSDALRKNPFFSRPHVTLEHCGTIKTESLRLEMYENGTFTNSPRKRSSEVKVAGKICIQYRITMEHNAGHADSDATIRHDLRGFHELYTAAKVLDNSQWQGREVRKLTFHG
jgi:hypothetical protein